jgi:hypothetical protein
MHWTEDERRDLEKIGARARGGRNQLFPDGRQGTDSTEECQIAKTDKIKLTWDTSYAGDEPIAHYEIIRDGELTGNYQHTPQISKVPFTFETSRSGNEFRLVAVDASGRKAASDMITA